MVFTHIASDVCRHFRKLLSKMACRLIEDDLVPEMADRSESDG